MDYGIFSLFNFDFCGEHIQFIEILLICIGNRYIKSCLQYKIVPYNHGPSFSPIQKDNVSFLKGLRNRQDIVLCIIISFKN